MFDWHEVWERKGGRSTTDLKELDGFEDTTIDHVEVAYKIRDILRIQQDDKVLEVGCGAGMITQHLDCDYVGVDYSRSLIAKHIEILRNSVLHGQANDLIFKDKSFDKVFSYSVFHYFPNKAYVKEAIKEMRRVAKSCIFIGDLPWKSHREEHLLFTRDEFKNAEISEGFYSKDRFNVFYDDLRAIEL